MTEKPSEDDRIERVHAEIAEIITLLGPENVIEFHDGRLDRPMSSTAGTIQ